MSSASDLIKEGRLDDAIDALKAQVRAEPAKIDHRVFLFQIFCVQREWERAQTQLQVCRDMDSTTIAMAQTYRELIRCEQLREEVYSGRKTPLVMGKPMEQVALMFEALRLSGDGHVAKAAEVQAKAFEDWPTTSGTIGGEAFEWVADADQRLGPMLECIIDGKYYWVPFARISKITTEAPEDLRDLVWQPANLFFANGGESVAFLPVCYPGLTNSSDPQLRLARRTEWEERDGVYFGVGQRMLATDQGEYPLLSIREIVLNSEPDDDADAADGTTPDSGDRVSGMELDATLKSVLK